MVDRRVWSLMVVVMVLYVGVSVRLGYRERLSVQHVLEEARESCPDELADVDPDTATYLVSDSLPTVSDSIHTVRHGKRDGHVAPAGVPGARDARHRPCRAPAAAA